MIADRGVEFEVDLENDAFAAAVPHETFRLLRAHAPVYWYDWPLGQGYWCITRYRDIVEVSRDHATFSSERGGANLEDLDEEQRRVRQSMLETDPPQHTRLRSLVNRDFTPRALNPYEPFLRALARRFISEAQEAEEFDFVTMLAKPFPINVLVRLLGAPPEDTNHLIELSDRLIGNTDPELADVLLESPESEQYRLLPFRSPAAVELFHYGHNLSLQRRAEPRDDIVSKLVNSEVDGDRLSEREFDTMFLLLVVAGNETTRAAIAHAMHTLIELPDVMRELQRDLSLCKTATDEILRWATPVLHFRRTATRDLELRGRHIRAGDKVVMWYISGNRDEEVFDQPFTFDIRRKANDHLAFGRGGPHFCLGANLARMEIRIMLEELLPKLGSIALNGTPERMRSNFTNAYKRLPVRVRWA
jgi:cytochrome P450